MSRSSHFSPFTFSGLFAIGAACAWFTACAGSDVPVDPNAGTGGTQSAAVGGSGGSGGRSGTGGSSMTGGTSGAGMGATGGSSAGGTAGTGGASDTCAEGPGLLVSKCGTVGCHTAGATIKGFAASETAAADFVDEPANSPACGNIIDSADPAESLIVKKILGTQGTCGSPMPLGPPLSATEKTCIETFIGEFAAP